MVRKSRLITELSKEEILEICVQCFDYKKEDIVSMRRVNTRPLRWRVTEIETGVKKSFNIIDPFDYDETILNSGLTPEQWRKFKTYCFEKGVCCKLYWEPNWKPDWYVEKENNNEDNFTCRRSRIYRFPHSS